MLLFRLVLASGLSLAAVVALRRERQVVTGWKVHSFTVSWEAQWGSQSQSPTPLHCDPPQEASGSDSLIVASR